MNTDSKNKLNQLLKKQSYREAEKFCEKFLQQKNDPYFLEVIARIKYNKNEIDHALNYLQQLVSTKKTSEFYELIGLCFIKKKDNIKAIENFDKALEIKPNSPELNFKIGVIYHELKKYGEAEIYYKKTLAFQPQNLSCTNNYASMLKTINRIDEAEELYSSALNHNQSYVPILINLADLKRERNQNKESHDLFKRALMLEPNNIDVLTGFSLLLMSMDNLNDAEEYMNKVLEMTPNKVPALVNLSLIYKKRKNYLKSEEILNKALQIEPISHEALINLAAIKLDKGEIDQAFEIYNKLIIRDDIKDEYLLIYADALGYSENSNNAIKLYEEVIANDNSGLNLRAAVSLSIVLYLNAEIEKIKEYLIFASAIQHSDISNKDVKISQIYWKYLALLYNWHSDNKFSKKYIEAPNSIHIIGESHIFSTVAITINIRGEVFKFVQHWIPGCKQWHVGNSSPNRFKYKLEKIFKSINKAEIICISIGEIDTRIDEPLFLKIISHPDRINELIEITVIEFYNYLNKFNMTGVRFIIAGVPCPLILNHYPVIHIDLFKNFVMKFNEFSKKAARQFKFNFIDFYSMTNDLSNSSSGKWHFDNFHLQPNAWEIGFSDYMELNDEISFS